MGDLGIEAKKINKIYHLNSEGLKHSINPRVFAKLQTYFGEKEFYSFGEVASVYMPMSITWTGNNSVATLPILLDLLFRGEFENFIVVPGDILDLDSMGAGTSLNTGKYKVTGLERLTLAV